MSMTTRLRSKKEGENAEPIKTLLTKAILGKSTKPADAADKRKAFGVLDNKLTERAVSLDDKGKQPYKDVKPRVDSRWKKSEIVAKRSSKDSAQPASVIPKPILVQKQPLKSSLSLQPKIETKHVKPIIKESKFIEVPLIKSPQDPLKLRRDRNEFNGLQAFECHSTKLLHQVDRIDEKDIGNPQMLADYVNDIYNYLFKLETIFPIRENFLASQTDVTPKMRSVLLDWINEVHHQFSLETETYYMAVSMIDRYLQAESNVSRKFLQLVGVTTLFMASKYEELMPPEITDFVYVTDDTYTKEQILHMEMKIFQKLQFNLSKPLPIHFFRRFAKAAGTLGDRQYLSGKYFMELASIEYELTKYHPSEIAAASLYLALYIFNSIKHDSDLWTPSLQFYTRYTSERLMPLMKHIAGLVIAAKDAKNKSIYLKYSNNQYKFTSQFPEMTGARIQELLRK